MRATRSSVRQWWASKHPLHFERSPSSTLKRCLSLCRCDDHCNVVVLCLTSVDLDMRPPEEGAHSPIRFLNNKFLLTFKAKSKPFTTLAVDFVFFKITFRVAVFRPKIKILCKFLQNRPSRFFSRALYWLINTQRKLQHTEHTDFNFF